MNHFTYVMFSPSRYQYYVGQSYNSPECAVSLHNTGKYISTKKGAPWQLVYSKQFENSHESYLLTQQLQHVKSRKFMRYFIERLRYKEKMITP